MRRRERGKCTQAARPLRSFLCGFLFLQLYRMEDGGAFAFASCPCFFSLFSIGGHALAVPSSVDRIIIIGG